MPKVILPVTLFKDTTKYYATSSLAVEVFDCPDLGHRYTINREVVEHAARFHCESGFYVVIAQQDCDDLPAPFEDIWDIIGFPMMLAPLKTDVDPTPAEDVPSITKSRVNRAYAQNIITVRNMTEMDPSANPYYNRPVAVIGDQWFAFGKEEDTLCVEATAYLANTPRIQVVQSIVDTLDQMNPTNSKDPYIAELYAYCDAYLTANNIR